MQHRLKDYNIQDLRAALESPNFSIAQKVKIRAEYASRTQLAPGIIIPVFN